jgi:hypothetical protein
MSRSARAVFGLCHLCLEETKLSFEHVPPEKAFNGTRLRSFGMDDWLKSDGELPPRGGRISQRGVGAYTLCEPCNNNTGGWYGREYVDWAIGLWGALAQIPVSLPEVLIGVQNRLPLRFLKQACAMFFSVNDPKSFATRHDDLVRFVLNKESREFPHDIDVCLGLYRGPIARAAGVTGKLEIASGMTELVSEVAYPPFALRLISNSGPNDRIGSIAHFRNYGFNDRTDLSLRVIVGEGHTPYPGDYRSKDRVLADRLADAMGSEAR